MRVVKIDLLSRRMPQLPQTPEVLLIYTQKIHTIEADLPSKGLVQGLPKSRIKVLWRSGCAEADCYKIQGWGSLRSSLQQAVPMTTKAGVSKNVEFPLIGSALGGGGAWCCFCMLQIPMFLSRVFKKSALHFYQIDY